MYFFKWSLLFFFMVKKQCSLGIQLFFPLLLEVYAMEVLQDAPTSKETSVGAGGPMTAMSFSTTSGDLKELEAEGSCRHLKVLLKVFLYKEGSCFPDAFL